MPGNAMNEGCHNVSPSAAPLSPCRPRSMASFMKSVHLMLGLPLFLCLLFFFSIVIFSKQPCLLVMGRKKDIFSFVISASSNVFSLISFRTHLFVYVAMQSTGRALLQHNISNKSLIFLSVFFTIQLSDLFTGIGNTMV